MRFAQRPHPTFNRIYGVKPGRDAPKLDRLLWFRSYYLRNLPLTVVGIVVLALLLGPSSHWLLAVIALPWVLGFARLNLEIRRAKRPPG
jgi:hypothetical protein